MSTSTRNKNKRKCDEIEELNTIINKNLKIDPIIVKNFMDACKSNDIIKLNKYLREQNVSPFMTDDESKTPLIVSIIAGSNDAAITLMKCKNSHFNHNDIFGNNALYYACLTQNYDIIKLLLKIPNINTEIIERNKEFLTDFKINDLFTKSKNGNLKSLKYSKFNPREVENNPQREFRASLIRMYGKCLITGTEPGNCDFIHICNPSKNKLEPYNPFNGLIISNYIYRKFYKKGLIKFNIESIKDISSYIISITLSTKEPEIMEHNNKEIWLPIQTKEYFF